MSVVKSHKYIWTVQYNTTPGCISKFLEKEPLERRGLYLSRDVFTPPPCSCSDFTEHLNRYIRRGSGETYDAVERSQAPFASVIPAFRQVYRVSLDQNASDAGKTSAMPKHEDGMPPVTMDVKGELLLSFWGVHDFLPTWVKTLASLLKSVHLVSQSSGQRPSVLPTGEKGIYGDFCGPLFVRQNLFLQERVTDIKCRKKYVKNNKNIQKSNEQ